MLQLITLCSRKGACGLPRLIPIHLPGDRGSTGIVVPIEPLALAAVSEADLETAAVGNALGIMRDDANAIGHPRMIPRSGPTGKRLEIVGRARSHRRPNPSSRREASGASPARASVALNRNRLYVMEKARALGAIHDAGARKAPGQ